jgi:hypothetical protein
VKAAFAEHGWSDYWILARGRDCEISELAAAIKMGRLTDGGGEPIIQRWPRTGNGIGWKRNLAFGIATNGPVRLTVVDEGGWRAFKPLFLDDIVYPNKLKTATTSGYLGYLSVGRPA